MRRVRNAEVMKLTKDPALATLMIAPDAEIYAIDVSFSQLKDKANPSSGFEATNSKVELSGTRWESSNPLGASTNVEFT